MSDKGDQVERIIWEEDDEIISIVGGVVHTSAIEPVTIWYGRHNQKYPNQSGNAHDRRKIRRANWRKHN